MFSLSEDAAPGLGAEFNVRIKCQKSNIFPIKLAFKIFRLKKEAY